MRKRDPKYKKEEIKNQKKKKKSIRLKYQDSTRQETQVHGEVPQPDDSA